MGERSFRFEQGKGFVGALLAASLLASACAKKSDEAAPLATRAAEPPPAAASAVAQNATDKDVRAPAAPLATATAYARPEEKPRGDMGGVGASGVLAPGKGRTAAEGAREERKMDGNMPAPPPPKAQAHTIIPGGGPVVPPPVDARPSKPAEAAIDPNGRFATTYRPGGGHLSAFESAVSRGIIPASERELVSDIGARYAAAVDAPKDKAMTISTELERGKLSPSGGAFHARLTLRSTAKAPSERPHLSVHLVLDVSGSMAGDSIVNARKAAQALVDKLAPGDDFSLVTFSSDAQVLITDGPVGTRREQIKTTIAGIKEGGGTNIGAGLTLGYEQAKGKGVPKDAVRVVMLLSDGHVNAGILDKSKLSKLALDAFQDGIQTSSFGLGAEYDGPLMSSIGSDGAGGYYYLRDSEQIAPALTTEIDKRLDPVATAVEVRVRLKKGAEVLKVYGSRRLNEAEAARVRAQEVAADQQAEKRDGIKRDRQDDQEGGMRFFMPAFARDDSHALLLKLRVPEGVGSKPLALVELKYKDRVTRKNVSEEFPIAVEYADADAASASTINASVTRTVQGFLAGEALSEAAALVERGDRAGAAALLGEREGILREAASQLGEQLFLKDADRIARLRAHTQTSTGMGEPLVLAMLLETAGRVHLR